MSLRIYLRTFFQLSFLGLSLFLLSCSDERTSVTDTVATIGSDVITVDDFRQEYELTTPVNRAGFKSIQDRKRAVLDNQIQNALFAVSGLAEGLGESNEAQDVLRYYEAHEVIRELYRDVVHARVRIVEADLRDAFVLSGETISLRQVLFTDSEEAEAVYVKIQHGESFEEVALNRARSEEELQHLLAPTKFSWGELDEPLEQAAFGLDVHQISAPIRSRLGFHIIQLVHRTETLIQTENAYQARKESLRKIMIRRREAAKAREYLNGLVDDEKPGIVGSAVVKLARAATAIFSSVSPESPVPVSEQVFLVGKRIGELNKIGIVKGINYRLSIGDLLGQINELPPSARFDLSTTGSITQGVAKLVRDIFLAREGYARGLEARSDVQDEVAKRRNEIASVLMRRMVLDSVTVTPEYAREYYNANRDHYRVPSRVRVREVMVRTKHSADSLYSAIKNGQSSLGEVAGRYSVREWARKKDGDLGYFASGAFGKLGEHAFKDDLNELEGPLPIVLRGIVSGYSVYQVLDRTDSFDPSFADIEAAVYDDALRERKSQVMGAFLANVRKDHPVHVNEEVLAAIHTTDANGAGKPIEMVASRRR